MLPAPQNSIYGNIVPINEGFESIIKAFENVSYMGELRQRWIEIKKLLKGELQDSNTLPSAMQTISAKGISRGSALC